MIGIHHQTHSSLGTPEPNLLQEGSIAVRIFSLRNCEVRFEGLPTRQIVRWIKLNASVAETAIRIQEILPGCYEWPQDCQDCCLDLCQLCFAVWGITRYSAMYLSILGTVHTSAPGLGCSLNRASHTSLVRHRLGREVYLH